MSYILLIISLFVNSIVFFGYIFWVSGRKHTSSRSLIFLFASAEISTVLFGISLLSEQAGVFSVFRGLYMASVDWFLLCLLHYYSNYADVPVFSVVENRFFPALAGIDLISFLVNPVKHAVFQIESTKSDALGVINYSISFGTLYYFHLLFLAAVSGYLLWIILVNLGESPRIYQKFYGLSLGIITAFGITQIIGGHISFVLVCSVLLCVFIIVVIIIETVFLIPEKMKEKTMKTALEDMNHGVLCFDFSGKCYYANHKVKELFGNKEKSYFQQLNLEWQKTYQLLGMDQEFSWIEEIESNDNLFYYTVRFAYFRDKKGKKKGYYYTLTDRTEEHLAYQTEKYHASHDNLTGLYNREYFFNLVEEELAKRPDSSRYMIATNIKSFKLINDLFGEKLGDIVLKEQAIALQRADYPGTIHGRICNDRYAMLIDADKFNPELASQNTSRLQNLLANYNYKLRVHIGIYKVSDPKESPVVMYDKASMAISMIDYDFQKMFCFYDDAIMDKLIEERNITSEFDEALKRGDFIFYLQPQMNGDCQLVGAEAVVRWNHPQKGIVKPRDFLSVLEKTGLIVNLDLYVWEEVVKRISEWKKRKNVFLPISVKISTKDFFFLDIFETFTNLVAKYEIEPADLNLEITEMVFMDDAGIHLEVVRKLQNAGFSIEIDDFGSGYSSLNLLKDIQANQIKIDMLFLQEMRYEERRAVILDMICKMAKKLNTTVSIEGIESVSQFVMMKKIGCQIFQGSYFSLPVSIEQFEELYM